MKLPNCSLRDTSLIRFFLNFLLIVFVPFSSPFCSTWDGGASTNNWMDEENWSGDVLPGPNDEATIHGYTVILPSGNSVNVKNVHMGGGAKLTIAGSATINCDYVTMHHENTELINNGTLQVNGGYTYGISLGGFTHFENNGFTNIFNAGANAALRFWGATVVNYGDILIDGTTARGDGLEILNYLTNVSSCINYGDITIRYTSGDGISGDGYFENFGNITISNVTYFEDLILDGESGLEFRNKPGATLKASGRIDPTTLLWQGGETSSDDGLGNTDIIEFFCLGNCDGVDLTNSNLMINIDGTSGPGLSNGHDLITVNKNAHLGGTIHVELGAGYEPEVGDAFTIMTYLTKSGPDPYLNFLFLEEG